MRNRCKKAVEINGDSNRRSQNRHVLSTLAQSVSVVEGMAGSEPCRERIGQEQARTNMGRYENHAGKTPFKLAMESRKTVF